MSLERIFFVVLNLMVGNFSHGDGSELYFKMRRFRPPCTQLIVHFHTALNHLSQFYLNTKQH